MKPVYSFLKTGISEVEAQTIVNVAGKLRNNARHPMVVSTCHTLMIAGNGVSGRFVEQAFTGSLKSVATCWNPCCCRFMWKPKTVTHQNGNGYHRY
ncbi:MAG: hypothetical protein R2861_05765 [Desulfobacterales bacterium]